MPLAADTNLNWIPEKWKKLIIAQGSDGFIVVNRKYFELCVLMETMKELQSGDLYVTNSDYRVQLIDWDVYITW